MKGNYTQICKNYSNTQRLVFDKRVEILNQPNVDIVIPNLPHTVQNDMIWLTDTPKIVIINT